MPTQPDEERNERGNALSNRAAAASWHAGVASVPGVVSVK